ncbi:hypothetical protein [uncultured Cohaesibacter sp.]|uniref:hypothetical protein n=1 Tax=uncultured Cohaesibacter sp. TaxID=1002546 RepID=UPI0029C65DEC|nr:hypothetical protein [uncultured Cohaesibacter sp.]
MPRSNLAAVAEAAAAQSGVSGEQTTADAPNAEQVSREEITAAEARGQEAGAAAERERLATILSAEGIAGNAARMSLAMELAGDAPGMSAEKVIGMATKYASADGQADSGMSLADRQADADPLGGAVDPGKGEAKGGIDTGAIYAKHNGAH